MQFGFCTDNVKTARAALILYALFRSRSKDSPLTGLETWNRFNAYITGMAKKSITTAEFVNRFCRIAKIGSIKPKYLKTKGDFVTLSGGSLIQSDDMYDYKSDVFADNSLLDIFRREGQYLTMLVRERLQREKVEYTIEEENDNED